MSAAPRIPSPTLPIRVPPAPVIARARARKAALGLAIAFLAYGSSGCASSFCGAPCEAGASPAARPAPPPENHFGTRFGHLDTWNMSPAQLDAERAELEYMLGADAKDAALLKVLEERKGGADGWIYDGFHAGGSRFRANGKLRREVGIEDVAKRVMIGIEESPSRDLFERYRLVRMQLLTLHRPPPEEDPVAGMQVDTVRAQPEMAPPPDGAGETGDDPVAGGGQAPDSSQAAVSQALPQEGPLPAEGPWSVFYRANSGAPTAVPDAFAGLDECKAWAESKAEEYRKEYFAFEFECRREGRAFKRKMW